MSALFPNEYRVHVDILLGPHHRCTVIADDDVDDDVEFISLSTVVSYYLIEFIYAIN